MHWLEWPVSGARFSISHGNDPFWHAKFAKRQLFGCTGCYGHSLGKCTSRLCINTPRRIPSRIPPARAPKTVPTGFWG